MRKIIILSFTILMFNCRFDYPNYTDNFKSISRIQRLIPLKEISGTYKMDSMSMKKIKLNKGDKFFIAIREDSFIIFFNYLIIKNRVIKNKKLKLKFEYHSNFDKQRVSENKYCNDFYYKLKNKNIYSQNDSIPTPLISFDTINKEYHLEFQYFDKKNMGEPPLQLYYTKISNSTEMIKDLKK